ncbi:hypothetical protein [Nocardiopsis aegyptia]|uniref:hypothetical protein n=1 Tax=Nocardiopsis aegyptia TaxID=220378 RepID=UPI0035E42141
MNSVARSMGVATMSLYRYVRSKDELLVAMADAAVTAPPEPEVAGWRDHLTVRTRAHRDCLLGRPWLLHSTRASPRRWAEVPALARPGTGRVRGRPHSTLTGRPRRAARATPRR